VARVAAALRWAAALECLPLASVPPELRDERTTDAVHATSRAEEARSWAPARIGDAQILVALGVAMAASAALGLYFSRDTSFWVDELDWFSTTPDLDLRGALDPYIGHLILTSRLIYAAILNTFGGGYLPFRLLTAGIVLLTAGLFFVFAKRRIGALAALAPTLVLLFYGSDSLHVLTGNSLTVLLSVAAGMGAFLALEREDLAGDLGACLLLCLAVATYSEGLPYLAGAAVLVLVGPDRRRRAWVFLIPALLYAAWWLWSSSDAASSTETGVTASDLLLAPNWAINSLASIGAALVGLDYAFSLGGDRWGWGTLVALTALVGLGWRLSRGHIPRWLWATAAVPATFWLLHAAAASPEGGREPGNSRYLFAGAVAVLLVAVEAGRGVRFGRGAILALYAVAAVGVITNIALLRDSSELYRDKASQRRATQTAIGLSERVGIVAQLRLTGPIMRETGETHLVTGYTEAARQFGSPAFSVPELREQSERIRELADTALADSLGLRLEPTSASPLNCRPITGEARGDTSFDLPAGGAVLSTTEGPAPVRLRRFATEFEAQVGNLEPGVPMALSIPADSAPDPWYASSPAAEVEVCALG
jgi:hypothetical protein